MNKFYVLILFFICSHSFAQSHFFVKSDVEIPLLTHDENRQIALSLNPTFFSDIKENHPCDFSLDLPFFDDIILNLELEAFNAYSDEFQILRSTSSGLIIENYEPNIQSYRIKGLDGWSGSISFMKDYLIGVIKKNGLVYEVKLIQDNTYVLFDVNDSNVESAFVCQTDTEDIEILDNNSQTGQLGGGPECLELGIEIDNYTYLQFDGNCYESVEWALALLAGVSEVYMAELNDLVELQARYVNVWEVVDNYDIYNDCGDMLDEMPNYWNNPPFSDIYAQTDLVHLFSRKNANGGIAWVGALCQGTFNGANGFGVTTGLNTNLVYSYPDNTPYSYNLSYLGHEIGHNFGASHTHNCSWNADASLNFPGGAIDACADVENVDDCVLDGIPFIPQNPPNEVWQQSSGTIMSYCDFSIGITLEFHPVVESQALIPGANGANCLNSCDDIETSCGNSIYGCTDPIAENYNSQANIDDSSCEYIYGCMSLNADNYNPNATMDDGTCICSGEIDLYIETDYYSNELSWQLLGDNGVLIDSGGDYFQGGEIISNNYCLAEGCYEFNIYDEWGDGISSNSTAGNNPNYYIYLNNEEYLVLMNDPDFGSESLNPFCIVICDADVDADGVCDEDEIYGCTDLNYLEYNNLATEDDGTCVTLIIEGCTDLLACNYDSANNLDDGSCEYPDAGFDCEENCLSDINNDGICDLFGCMNSDACNYNSIANLDDDSCEFPNVNFDCDGNCLVDVDCSGECGGDAIYDECGICSGDNNTCLGCTDFIACNYDDLAIIDDDSCEYPLSDFDCDGNCLVDLDCSGECGGEAIYDECGICDGFGPEEFYDCDGNCLSDLDDDGICDQLDNCLEEFNPSQIDNDGDGYGDECSCQYIDIEGEIIVEAGIYEIYTLSNFIDNTASWEVIGGNIVWNSATEPSIGVEWLQVGEGTVSIIQYFGTNQTCSIDLNVTVIPSTIGLSEDSFSNKKIILVTDVLGREIKENSNHQCLIYIHEDGTVKKIYNVK